MTIQFGPQFPQGNRRGEVQIFIETKVGRDNDFYTSAVSTVAGNYVLIRLDFHTSPSDSQRHITGDVFVNGKQLGTAHVYENGQVTIFPSGSD
ncbi:hypothetical protein ONZ51_g10692 [Trametes cubensis]|uniref:Uncharacterized protein n=1 Tax=Trametes cubensis TaxID=1111947 RepID=A0AAD7X638_9APHY|nr:hypothetical protein ONZ51_g10692 [Trametes cubensis]